MNFRIKIVCGFQFYANVCRFCLIEKSVKSITSHSMIYIYNIDLKTNTTCMVSVAVVGCLNLCETFQIEKIENLICNDDHAFMPSRCYNTGTFRT